MNLFLPNLVLTLLVLVIAYALGRLLLGRAAEASEPYFGVMLALTCGLSLLVGLYAVFRTAGHTILLPLPLLLGWVVWKQRGRVPGHVPTVPRALGNVLLVGALLYTARFLCFYNPGSSYLLTPFEDFIFYARVSVALNEIGVESVALESAFPQFIAAQPYHYYELWLNALLVQLTGWSALWCLCLTTYTVLLTVVVLGIRALVAHFGKSARWAWGLTALLSLSSGVNWPVFTRFAFTSSGSLLAGSRLFLMEPKLAPIALFIALSTLLLVRRRYDLAGMVLAVIPLVYVSTGPAIGGSVVMLAGYLLLSRRATPAEVLSLLGPIVLAVGYFGLFYAVQPVPVELPQVGNTLFDEVVPKLSQARTLLNLFIGTLLLYGLYFSLPLVACAVVATRATRLRQWQALLPVLVWMAGGMLLAAAGYSLASRFIDAFQFSGNVTGALMPVGLAVLLGSAFPMVSAWRRAVALLLLAVAVVVNYYPLFQHKIQAQQERVYADGFLRQVQNALPDKNVRVGFLLSDNDYKNTYMLSEDTYAAGTYVAGLSNKYDLISLSLFAVDSLTTDPRFKRDSVQARQRLHSASLYRYSRLRPVAPAATLESLQYQFVKQFNIAFVCVSATAALPNTLRPLVEREIRDPRSGEKFYVLNHPQ
jgi:hypothetical protein